MKLWEGWEKLHTKATQIELWRTQVFFWKLYITTATAFLKAEPAFPCVTTENTKHQWWWDRTGGSCASRETQVQQDAPCFSTPVLPTSHPCPSTIPVQAGMDQGWRVHGEAAFSLLCSVLLLFQICISSFAPLSLPIFPLFHYLPSLKTSPSFLISMKCSLWRVKFILFNVLLLDKHLWTAICLAEVLFPFDTGRQPASCFL